MTVREYVSVLIGYWRLIAACTLAGALLATLAVLIAPPKYSAHATFYISTQGGSSSSTDAYQGSLLSQERVKSYTELLSSHRLASAIVDDSRIEDDPEDIAEEITASITPDTVLLAVEVVDPSAERANTIAGSITRTFPLLVASLERPTSNAPPTVSAQLVEGPLLDPDPVSPRPVLWIVLGTIAGLVLGIGLSLVRDALDQSIRSVEQLRLIWAKPILATVPADSSVDSQPIVILDKPSSALAESVRRIRTNLDMLNFDRAAKCFVITSAVENEGKSVIATNLAMAQAAAGVRVLLIEGDLRKPRSADYLGVARDVGLSQVIAGRLEFSEAIQPGPTANMSLLAAGPLPPNPYEMLESAQMAALVTEAREKFDVVLIDAPPLLPVADSLALVRIADAVLVVVMSGLAPKTVIARGREQLDDAGVERVGLILNGVNDARSGYGGAYYGERGGSYTGSRDEAQEHGESKVSARHGTPSARAGASQPSPRPREWHEADTERTLRVSRGPR